jgi:hypothetical protein
MVIPFPDRLLAFPIGDHDADAVRSLNAVHREKARLLSKLAQPDAPPSHQNPASSVRSIAGVYFLTK